MRLALLALAALAWIAVPVSARAEGETVDTWDDTAIAGGFAGEMVHRMIHFKSRQRHSLRILQKL